jgi:hypothetical protein
LHSEVRLTSPGPLPPTPGWPGCLGSQWPPIPGLPGSAGCPSRSGRARTPARGAANLGAPPAAGRPAGRRTHDGRARGQRTGHGAATAQARAPGCCRPRRYRMRCRRRMRSCCQRGCRRRPNCRLPSLTGRRWWPTLAARTPVTARRGGQGPGAGLDRRGGGGALALAARGGGVPRACAGAATSQPRNWLAESRQQRHRPSPSRPQRQRCLRRSRLAGGPRRARPRRTSDSRVAPRRRADAPRAARPRHAGLPRPGRSRAAHQPIPGRRAACQAADRPAAQVRAVRPGRRRAWPRARHRGAWAAPPTPPAYGRDSRRVGDAKAVEPRCFRPCKPPLGHALPPAHRTAEHTIVSEFKPYHSLSNDHYSEFNNISVIWLPSCDQARCMG